MAQPSMAGIHESKIGHALKNRAHPYRNGWMFLFSEWVTLPLDIVCAAVLKNAIVWLHVPQR